MLRPRSRAAVISGRSMLRPYMPEGGCPNPVWNRLEAQAWQASSWIRRRKLGITGGAGSVPRLLSEGSPLGRAGTAAEVEMYRRVLACVPWWAALWGLWLLFVGKASLAEAVAGAAAAALATAVAEVA